MAGATWDAATRKLWIDGLVIINPGERPDAKMGLEDFGPRPTTWIRQITIHTTSGKWPQPILPGAGPAGRAEEIAEYWKNNKEYGGAPFVIDCNGDVWCLIDPFKNQVWHATTVNEWSIGIEMCTLPNGSIYQATLDACVKLVMGLNELCGIPMQITSVPYVSNQIIQRLKDGGRNVVGDFGHRNNAWVFPYQYKYIYNTQAAIDQALKNYPNGYANRGEGDPGNRIYDMLYEAGALKFNFDKLEEVAFWKPIQRALNKKHGTTLEDDGVYGPSLHKVMVKYGYWQYGGVVDPNLLGIIENETPAPPVCSHSCTLHCPQ